MTEMLGGRILRSTFTLASYLSLCERAILRRYTQPSTPQLFILGLPRSGTTLIYQYVVHRLKVSYYTNGVGRHPRAPCLVTMLQRRRHGDYHSDFKSHYGKVSGAMAPREAGSFWGRFFDPDNYVEYEDLTAEQVQTLQQTVACIEDTFGIVPFVNKNVKHLLRIGALSKIFPSSRFLLVERDRASIALSLLRGRYETLKDPREWLSARPPDYDSLKDLPIIEQIAGQLASLHAKAHADLNELEPERVLHMNYGSFCERPEYLTELIDSGLGRLPRRNPPVERFTPTPRQIRNDMEASLVDLIDRSQSPAG